MQVASIVIPGLVPEIKGSRFGARSLTSLWLTPLFAGTGGTLDAGDKHRHDRCWRAGDDQGAMNRR